MHECASIDEHRRTTPMGQLETHNGAPATASVPKDTTGRGAPPSGPPLATQPGAEGGAMAVPKDTTSRSAPPSTGSPDKLDASNKVD
jgi:hypothetical protein